jgi:hypothetical protein
MDGFGFGFNIGGNVLHGDNTGIEIVFQYIEHFGVHI